MNTTSMLSHLRFHRAAGRQGQKPSRARLPISRATASLARRGRSRRVSPRGRPQ
jgi:hypothetical protein